MFRDNDIPAEVCLVIRAFINFSKFNASDGTDDPVNQDFYAHNVTADFASNDLYYNFGNYKMDYA
mgnify:CR=1 FL=1